MHASLDIFARLVVSVAGNDIIVRAADGLITVELPNLRTGRALLKTWPVRSEGVKLIEGAQATLADSGQRLEFQMAGRAIAKLGIGVRPGLASWLLGLRPLEIRPLQMLLALTSSNHVLASKGQQ
jgi:hypothetical protein